MSTFMNVDVVYLRIEKKLTPRRNVRSYLLIADVRSLIGWWTTINNSYGYFYLFELYFTFFGVFTMILNFLNSLFANALYVIKTGAQTFA